MATKKLLKDMSRKEIVKIAKGLGVKVLKKHTDREIRDAIRSERKGKSKPAKEKATKLRWPKEWSTEMRQSYHMAIVGREAEKLDDKSYRAVLRAIEAKVPHVIPEKTKTNEYDCFGLYYDEKHDYCNSASALGCPVMPLCRETCEQRPELQRLVGHLADASDEASKLTEEEKAEASKAAGKGKGKGKGKEKTSKKATKKTSKVKADRKKMGPAKASSGAKKRAVGSSSRYYFTGNLASYRRQLDEGSPELEYYEWMSKKKKGGFTREQLIDFLDHTAEEPEDAADTLLDYLKSENELRVE